MRLSLNEILEALYSVVSNNSRTFIIIDGLDECQFSDGGPKRFLSEILNLQAKTQVNIFATSRPIQEIKKVFEGSVFLEIRARDKDVETYLDGHMARLPSCVLGNPALQEKVKAEIIKAVDGMYVCFNATKSTAKLANILYRFLLAHLHLESLMDKTRPKEIKSALKKLPKGSEAYDEAYKEAMKRIEGQKPGFRDLAKQVLSWIICAKRPLTTLELRHALGVEISEPKLDEDNLSEIEVMVSVCAGLVTVDEESNIVRLVHYTTQEYFERSWVAIFPNAQTDITTACVTYLLFDAFEPGFCTTDEEFQNRRQLNALYDYAARNWGHHARLASEAVEELILDFLSDERKISGCSQAMMVSGAYSNYSQRVPRQITGVHIAAYFGLWKSINALIEHGHDPNLKDTDGRTPLSWAAGNGHEGVVKQLLAKNGVDVDSKDKYGRTPLSWAARNGHGFVKQLLAKDDVDADSKDKYGRTPLSWAAGNGHEGVVNQLLAKDGVDADSKDTEYGQTPLSWAAENGHEAVVKQLLAKDGVDADSKDKNGWTPLSQAAGNGHEGVVKQLLAKDGVNADSKDEYGRTPLSRAAENGHEGVVKQLQGL